MAVFTDSTLMPLMRDITCVTSSNSSRDRQRSTLAACSSPMLSSTMAACSTGFRLTLSYSAPSEGLLLLLSSAIFLHPLFDDFGDTLGFFFSQHFQVIDHHVDRRAWWRQIIVFQQRHDWHVASAGLAFERQRAAIHAQGWRASGGHAIRAGAAAAQCQGGIELF